MYEIEGISCCICVLFDAEVTVGGKRRVVDACGIYLSPDLRLYGVMCIYNCKLVQGCEGCIDCSSSCSNDYQLDVRKGSIPPRTSRTGKRSDLIYSDLHQNLPCNNINTAHLDKNP